MDAQVATTSRPGGAPDAFGARLHGRRLVAARILWAGLVVLVLGLFVVATVARYRRLISPPQAVLAYAARLGVSVGLLASYLTALNVVYGIACLGVGLVIVWRRRNEAIALLVALFLVLAGTANAPNASTLEELYPSLTLPAELANLLIGAAQVYVLFLFPDGRFVPRWAPPLALADVAGQLVALLVFGESVSQPRTIEVAALELGGLGAGALAQLYRYRRVSTPVQRQQTKWVVFGTAASILAFLVALGCEMLFPALTPADLRATPYDLFGTTIITLGSLVFPLSLALAVLRYRLWDIDLLVRRALVYTALTISLVLVYLAGVVAFQRLFRSIIGQQTELAVVAFTLAIAALFQPLRGLIQREIDRRFYRRKYDAAKVLAGFGATVRDEVDLTTLSARLIQAVEDTMEPAHVTLWLRSPDGASPRGRARTAELTR